MRERVPEILLLASIGLVLLSFLATRPPAESRISELERSEAGEMVVVYANVSESYRSGGNSFLTLEDRTGNISAVHFSSGKSYSAGDRVLVSGQLELHEGKLQILIQESSIVPS